jgi:hypothetical protein
VTQYFYDFKSSKPPAGDNPPDGFGRVAGGPTSGRQFFARKGVGIIDAAFEATSDYVSGRLISPLAVNAADVEVLVKFRDTSQQGGTSYPNGGLTCYARVGASGQPRYEFAYQASADGTSSGSFIRSRLPGGVTADIHNGSSGVSGKEIKWARFSVVGTSLKMKMWNDGQSEPSAWGPTGTSSVVPDAGRVAIGWLGGNSRVKELFQVSVGTDGDVAPLTFPGGARTVSGTVRKPNGDLAVGYIVRCYSRSTGMILGETLTDASGNYVFTLDYADKVTCVAVDQLGNTWNAPVKDLVNPIVV